MNISVEVKHGTELVDADYVARLADFVMHAMELPDNTDVSITFVTDDEIHRLNRDFRSMDKPTDVLSFECDGLDDEMSFDDGQVYELGDVIIATDVASRQTEEFGTTFTEELSLLITHGLLHLCGYDHIEDDEAEEMEALEAELLSRWENHR